ncbi:MAG: NAD+ synthase [Acidimicrobiia bacterium]|nr:NAD+ synthase [Acidimicrobiia bacterium]
MRRIRVGLCQLNTVVGDLDGNVARILGAYDEAAAAGCDVAVFPELAITGYPPEDLLLKPGFIAAGRDALDLVADRTGRCAAVVGFVDVDRDLRNAAAVCAEGTVVGTYHKRLLPNYAVFDEQRYFAPGTQPYTLFRIAGVAVGVSICEDMWSPNGPLAEQAAGGAELLVNLNASPYHRGRRAERERMLATRAEDATCTLVYVNQVGGQDELLFDGASLVLDADGEVVTRLPQFAEAVGIVDLEVRPVFRTRLLEPRGRAWAPALPVVEVTAGPAVVPGAGTGDETPIEVTSAPSPDGGPTPEPRRPPTVTPYEPVREVYEALVVGTRDYVHKNGFTDVVIGLSGGVDSSLVAAVAVDALSAEHVHGVSMPSRYSSDGSRTDAERMAAVLGIDYRTIAIEAAHAAFLELLGPSYSGLEPGLAEENLQPRIRGTLLMALSNKFPGWLVLTTGNKSELAVGYSTLYGDTAGGFAVIKDVPKLLVYELCRDRNARAGRELIPEAVLTKAPSAELRPDQRDDDSLPPYEVLDPLLEAYVERDLTRLELVAAGFSPDLVARITRLVDVAEYKRRQNPPGPRISLKAFGKDRRMPITNHFTG